MNDRLCISVDNHVAEVMLNRPEKYNALDMRMFEALGEAADSLRENSSIRAVVLHGAGDNFCAGIDVHVLSDPAVRIDETIMQPVAPSPGCSVPMTAGKHGRPMRRQFAAATSRPGSFRSIWSMTG